MPVVLYGCETWCHTLREEQAEGVRNRVLRKMCEVNWTKYQGSGEDYIRRSFVVILKKKSDPVTGPVWPRG